MLIRKAGIDDLNGLSELFNEYRIFYKKETDIEGAKQFLKERLLKNDSEIFISFSDTVMTGFVQLYPLFSSTRIRKLLMLNDLFVNEKFRGQGVSLALINRAKELCLQTGACGFMLETAKTNLIANSLYQKINLKLDTDYNVYTWDV